MEKRFLIGSDKGDDPLVHRRERVILSGPYKLNHQTRATRTLSELCNFCKEVIAQWPRPPGQESSLITHHSSFDDLRASADQGCGLCAQFIVGADEFEEFSEYLEADGSVPTRGVVTYIPKASPFWPEASMRLKLLIPCNDERALGYSSSDEDEDPSEPDTPDRITFEVDMLPAAQIGETLKNIYELAG